MIRSPEELTGQTFDVLVVGGGIHGSMVAWDAALRGLSVALVERGDFGGATSQNSLKIIHGGLRYLPDFSLRRFRLMARERSTWLRIAPHLVHPLPFVTPTYSNLPRSRTAMWIGLKLNDFLSVDRNWGLDTSRSLPGGRVFSRPELEAMLPGLDCERASGGAVWYDAQMYSSERLLLEAVLSATEAGAQVSNYLEAVALLLHKNAVRGARVRDRLSGREFEVSARLVINCAGAWIDQLLQTLGRRNAHSHYLPSVAINLIVDRVWDRYAVGLPARANRAGTQHSRSPRSKMIFIVPWRDKSIIGTWHAPWNGPAEDFLLHEDLVREFIDEVNRAHPDLGLAGEDIRYVQHGFLPVEAGRAEGDRVKLTREAVTVDHKVEDALDGLISVVGVKYTTSRAAAAEAVDLALSKLGWDKTPSQTASTPLWGGDIQDFQGFLSEAKLEAGERLSPDTVEHLVHTYGSKFRILLDLIDQQPALGEKIYDSLPVTGAEIVHAVRHEMAQTLLDVVCRRTELGAVGQPPAAALEGCAALAAGELGWEEARRKEEIRAVIQWFDQYRFGETSPAGGMLYE